MSRHSYSGLYYPFIHFKDDRWLKLSALYWDRMARIVPTQYHPDDSDTVRALGDYVESIPPAADQRFGKTFTEFVEEYSPALHELYRVDRRDRWPVDPYHWQPPDAGGPSGSDPRLRYVFHQKMPEQLREALFRSRIAEPDPGDDRWIGMHPRLTQLYMTVLAGQLAGQMGLYPITDEVVDHVAVGGLSVERLAQVLLGDVEFVTSEPTTRETESVAAYLAIQTVLPKNIENVPVEKILKFRETYAGERGAFQSHIAEFVQSREWLNDIDNPDTLGERIRDEYDKELKPKLDEFRGNLHDMNIQTISGSMAVQVSAPFVSTLGAAAFGVALPPAGLIAATVAGAALALIPVLRARREARGKLMSSPLAYLMRMEKELQPGEVTSWIRESAKLFRFRAPAS